MSKTPSDATLLRSKKAELAHANKKIDELLLQGDAYRARATKAEQECAEWKARFDVLLRREEKRNPE